MNTRKQPPFQINKRLTKARYAFKLSPLTDGVVKRNQAVYDRIWDSVMEKND